MSLPPWPIEQTMLARPAVRDYARSRWAGAMTRVIPEGERWDIFDEAEHGRLDTNPAAAALRQAVFRLLNAPDARPGQFHAAYFSGPAIALICNVPYSTVITALQRRLS